MKDVASGNTLRLRRRVRILSLRKIKSGTHEEYRLGRGIRLGRRFFALPLTSKLDALCGSNATPLHTSVQCSKNDLYGKKIRTPQWSPYLFGAEGGIRTLVWCYPQTDFESVR